MKNIKLFSVLLLLLGALVLDVSGFPFEDPPDTPQVIQLADLSVDLESDSVLSTELDILLPIFPFAPRELKTTALADGGPIDYGGKLASSCIVADSFSNADFILSQDTAFSFYDSLAIHDDQTVSMLSQLDRRQRDSLLDLTHDLSQFYYDVLQDTTLSDAEAYNRLYGLTKRSVYKGWAAHNYNLRLLSVGYLLAVRYSPPEVDSAKARMTNYATLTNH